MQKVCEPGRQEIENYFSSYVGMEGGNLRASVWICDRSPYPWLEPFSAPLQPRTEPPSWDEAFRARYGHKMPRWLQHQRIARFMAAARAEALDVQPGNDDWIQYFANHLYAPRGWEFRLNLFPLPVQLDGLSPWSKVFRGYPELLPKARYLELCRQGSRFGFLRNLRLLWRPKLIVCFGYRHAKDYLQAFGLDDVEGEDIIMQPADLKIVLKTFQKDESTIIICPALAGSAGMASDVLLNAFGKFIGARLDSGDFGESVEAC